MQIGFFTLYLRFPGKIQAVGSVSVTKIARPPPNDHSGSSVKSQRTDMMQWMQSMAGFQNGIPFFTSIPEIGSPLELDCNISIPDN